MGDRKRRPRPIEDDSLLEPRHDPETPEESEDYRREEERRHWEENRPPHHEER